MNRTPLSEPMAQRWRALVVLNDGQEALLCLGKSHIQVQKDYTIPWWELFDRELQKQTKHIVLQRWVGASDRGKWMTQDFLKTP